MNALTAQVQVNGVDVGTLPADVYDQLVKDVRRRKILYLRQAQNFLWVMIKFLLTWFLIAMIVALFLSATALFYDASLLPALVDSFRSSPIENTHWVRNVIGNILLITFMFLAPSWGLLKLNTGYINHFDIVIAEQLKYMLEVPAEGPVEVFVKRIHNNSDDTVTTSYGFSEHDGK